MAPLLKWVVEVSQTAKPSLSIAAIEAISVEDLAHSPKLVRFGMFEVDLRAGELWKSGRKRRLTGQPFLVLAMLLERPGEMVTREELQQRLWPDTFVDVEHSLNTAINKIREALNDSAESPHFVETLPRRGYRFIALVDSGKPVKPTAKTPACCRASGVFAGGGRPSTLVRRRVSG